MNGIPILTILTFAPAVGALLVLSLRRHGAGIVRRVAFAFSLLTLALGLALWVQFDAASGDLQFVERHAWISALAVEYHVGVDGLGLLMVLLSAIVVPMSMLASWTISERVAPYFSLVLLLETGLLGTFTALNFFHWFLFWELSLIPAFFLIKLWGGPERSAAAIQFFIYTMAGSVSLLLAFLALFLATGKFDFVDLAELARQGNIVPALAAKLGWHDLTARQLALVVFLAAFLGFAVKVPLIPFHTWLPATYAEAPPGVTMLLTGLMSKMGVYGFIRILVPIFAEEMQWVLRPLLWLAVVSIVVSAFAAFAQRDLKRMLAYSSINHLGYCLLGVFALAGSDTSALSPGLERAAALNGVFLQMFNHGLTAAALFWLLGLIERRSGGLRGLNDFGGLRRAAPVFCGFMGIALFSSLGLPGLNGFVGEFLIFKGVFPLATWAAALSCLGLLITAVLILTLIQRVFSGPLNERWAKFPDLSFSERMWLLPAIVLMFLLGVYPQLLLGVVNSTVKQMVAQLRF